MDILKTESYRKGILLSSVFNIGGKSIAFIQQWLIGYFLEHILVRISFFYLQYYIIYFLFFLNLSTSVLIPESINIRNQENEEKSMAF